MPISPPKEHLASFPGDPDQIRAVRRFVADALGPGHPRAADAILLVSEIATNAVRHTSSAGAAFDVAVAPTRDSARITVRDAGGSTIPCGCRIRRNATGGRGLALVETIANSWGFTRAGTATAVWFELAPEDERFEAY
ncbi:ATP-binding protein [Bailinhaonella thermotolerans]|uniref:ATP-binding protein n=1 Tax=Bailinhaonella thermotolerans TaxID=1070861 RepID=A0A3A4AZE7_9ACTN|nr:ATP-binding protein [Bailinhaonella thermotolerans]RJL34503.1 ATP-binding protein [Bailinhaonella thermotolerans]